MRSQSATWWGATAVLGVLATLALPPLPAAASGPACDPPATRTISAEPWASRRLDYRSVWPLTRGAGVVVAVVDTGVDAHHPLLRGRVLSGIDVTRAGGRGDRDCAGHGTAVAGIIAAAEAQHEGFAGVAPAATILPVRQTSTDGNGTIATLAAGIRAAVDGGADVVNVSVVVADPHPALAAAVRYASDHNVVVVAAAGNDASKGNPPQYPAAYPGVIAVGAVGPDGRVSEFSESGTAICVVAPGVDIVAPGAGGNGLVSGLSGTSFAAAFVTGVVALVRAYRPGLTAAEVKHRIEVTADHPATSSLRDPGYGFGVVAAYRAVAAELPGEATVSAAAAPGGVRRLPPAATPAPRDRSVERVTVFVSALDMIAALLVALAIALRKGGRRRWRAAGEGR